jgi:hypothetical protein
LEGAVPSIGGAVLGFSGIAVIFSGFLAIFSRLTKAKRILSAIYIGMRENRKLAKNVWYEVRTAINVSEPLFQLGFAVVLLYRVLCEARGRFVFEMRGLAVGDEWLSFYIKPADGFQLPRIMQWVKQTFSVRFNMRTGRTGHVWGDRYGSEILPGEPPEGVVPVDWERMEAMAKTPVQKAMTYALSWDSPRLAGKAVKMGFSFKTAPFSANPPG